MKKTVLALAVMAASGAAMAQSSVELYGLVDLIVHKDKGQATAMTSGGMATSRWGLRGSEDLGGGLKAVFKLEQQINADTGTVGAGFSRESYLGLEGGFGMVKFGKVWTAYDDVAAAGDGVFNANVFSPINLIFNSWASYNANPNNGLYYATPEFGGFSGAVSYALDETNGVNDNVVAYHIKYANGPVAVALAYQDDGDTADERFTTLNGSYDFGPAVLKATYARVNRDVGVDAKEYTLGVDVPLSDAMTASVAYGRSKDDGAAKAATSFSGALAYSLSKRTTVYAGFARTNDTAVASRGAPKTRYGLGVQHSF